MKRTDELGRAFAGSQLQMQIYVNRRPAELSEAVGAKISKESFYSEQIRWVSPLESERFAEYRDGKFLDVLGLGHLRPSLAKFWPPGGPRWDALAVVDSQSDAKKKTVILVEAKSYPGEVYGNGCGADSNSLLKIQNSLDQVKKWFNIQPETNWTGPLYQSANRLAHLYFFRKLVEIEAWLINICFLNDHHSPTNLKDWEIGLNQINAEFGFDCHSFFTVNVFLPARLRIELFQQQNSKSIFKQKF